MKWGFMKEIEVKILEVDVSKIRKTLKDNHAKFVKKVLQKNHMYGNEHTRKNDVVVRIRREGKNTIFTIKGRKEITNNHKVRDEYELCMDYDMISNMIKLLGLKLRYSLEMKREYWNIGGCSVEICQLPKLPAYIEIEGSAKGITKVAKMLGYSEKDFFNDSFLKHYGLKDVSLRF